MTRPFFSLKGRAHSFVYAGCGVITLLKTQHNTDKAKRDDAFKYVPLTLSELCGLQQRQKKQAARPRWLLNVCAVGYNSAPAIATTRCMLGRVFNCCR